jgi:hypothetical protein
MRSQEIDVIVGASTAQILPANPHRVCLIFSYQTVNIANFILVGRTLGTGSNFGIMLSAYNPVVKVTWDELGEQITQPWVGSSNAANQFLRIVEGNA